jgi:hypothetical protein
MDILPFQHPAAGLLLAAAALVNPNWPSLHSTLIQVVPLLMLQGFGWAIAKALAEAGAEISLGVWVGTLT